MVAAIRLCSGVHDRYSSLRYVKKLLVSAQHATLPAWGPPKAKSEICNVFVILRSENMPTFCRIVLPVLRAETSLKTISKMFDKK